MQSLAVGWLAQSVEHVLSSAAHHLATQAVSRAPSQASWTCWWGGQLTSFARVNLVDVDGEVLLGQDARRGEEQRQRRGKPATVGQHGAGQTNGSRVVPAERHWCAVGISGR